MKILYIYTGARDQKSSISIKILSMIESFKEHGWDVHGAFFLRRAEESPIEHELIEKHYSDDPEVPILFKFRQKEKSIQLAYEYLLKHADDYDWIYFRYPNATPRFGKIVRRFGSKMIIEHNARELGEMAMYLNSLKLRLNVSSILGYTDYLTKYLFEKYYAPRLLRKARIGIANTPETKDYQLERCPSYNCKYMSNGIDFKRVPKKEYCAFDGSSLRLLVLRGSMGSGYYDGYERLIQGIQNYKGPVKIEVFFVGKQFAREKQIAEDLRMEEYCHFMGPLYDMDLDDMFNSCHLSIGPLALFRKNMAQGSILRVNESIARGMPVVIGYRDVELTTSADFEPYYLKVAADDTVLDMEAVIDFASKVSEKGPSVNQSLRGLAENQLSYTSKVKLIERFIEESAIKQTA